MNDVHRLSPSTVDITVRRVQFRQRRKMAMMMISTVVSLSARPSLKPSTLKALRLRNHHELLRRKRILESYYQRGALTEVKPILKSVKYQR